MDVLCAGTPSLTVVKLLLSAAAEGDLPVMLPGARCAFCTVP